VLEPAQQVPLRLVVEQHDVEVVAEALGDRLHRRVTAHPHTTRLDTLREIEGHRVAARDQPVRELHHAPDATESLEMGLDEAETQTPPCHTRIVFGRIGTIATVRAPREAFRRPKGSAGGAIAGILIAVFAVVPLLKDIQDASNKWASTGNPFFAGDMAWWLGMVPFLLLALLLYLVGREKLLKGENGS